MTSPRLSKLQRRILELALVEYEKPAEIVTDKECRHCAWRLVRAMFAGLSGRDISDWWPEPKPAVCACDSLKPYEPPTSRTVRVRDLVKAIYGVELGWRVRCGLWNPSTDDQRQQYRAAIAAISRSLKSLRDAGLADQWYMVAGSYMRLTERGAALARDAKREPVNEPPAGAWLTPGPITVTTCPCGAPLDAQRSTRRYCSAACRQSAYRVRHD